MPSIFQEFEPSAVVEFDAQPNLSVLEDDEEDSFEWVEEDDYTLGTEITWPKEERMIRPPVKGLIAHGSKVVPAPQPIDPYFQKKFDEYLLKKKEVEERIKGAVEKVSRIADELKKAQEVPKTYAAKWSSVGSGNGREALINRLTADLEKATAEKRKIETELEKLNVSNRVWVAAVQGAEHYKKVYSQYIEDMVKSWDRQFPGIHPHTPLTKKEDVLKFYRAREFDNNLFVFPLEADIKRCMRELYAGGMSYQHVADRVLQVNGLV